jgi:hypothetical protein
MSIVVAVEAQQEQSENTRLWDGGIKGGDCSMVNVVGVSSDRRD